MVIAAPRTPSSAGLLQIWNVHCTVVVEFTIRDQIFNLLISQIEGFYCPFLTNNNPGGSDFRAAQEFLLTFSKVLEQQVKMSQFAENRRIRCLAFLLQLLFEKSNTLKQRENNKPKAI